MPSEVDDVAPALEPPVLIGAAADETSDVATGVTAFPAAAVDGLHDARQRRKRFYVRGVVSGVAARGVNTLVQVLSLYLTTHYLNDERYGMWTVISTIAAFLALANFGLGNGLVTRLSEYSGKGDDDGAARAATSTFVLVSVTSLALLLLLIGPALVVPWARVFHVASPLAVQEARPTVLVVLSVVLLLLPLSVGGAVLLGHQRADLVNGVTVVTSLTGLGLLFLGTRLHWGLPTLAFCLLAPAVLSDAIQMFVAWRLKYARFGRQHLDLGEAWSMLKLGTSFLGLQIMGMIVFQTGALIIAARFDAAAVAPYGVTYRLVMITSTVLAVLLTPLTPAYGEAFARGDREWVRRVFIRSILVFAVTWVPIAVFLIAAGKPIIRVWAGAEKVPSTLLLVSLIVYTMGMGLGTVVANLLNGLGKLSSQLVGGAIMSVLHIPFALFLAGHMGVGGVALSQGLLQLLIAVPLAYVHAFRLLRPVPAGGLPPEREQAPGGFPIVPAQSAASEELSS